MLIFVMFDGINYYIIFYSFEINFVVYKLSFEYCLRRIYIGFIICILIDFDIVLNIINIKLVKNCSFEWVFLYCC